MERFRRFVLTMIGLLMFFHSISLFALTPATVNEDISVEMSEDREDQTTKVYAYDALIPAIQEVVPLVMYYLGEIVLLSEVEYLQHPLKVSFHNTYLEVLFRRIISPNAP